MASLPPAYSLVTVNARPWHEPPGRGAPTGTAPSPRLLERLRARDRDSIAELLTLFGRPMVGVAYAVLQDRAAAERAVAVAIARSWRRPPTVWPGPMTDLAPRMAADAAREALAMHQAAREVDAMPQPAADRLLELRAEERAAVALEQLAGLEAGAAVSVLGLRGGARRRALRVFQESPTERDGVRGAVASNVAGLPVAIGPSAVLALLDAPLPGRPAAWRRGVVPAAAIVVAGLLVAVLLASPGEQDRASLPAASGLEVLESAAPVAAVDPPLPSVGELASPPSLADCGIRPSDAELAFTGWTTLAQLGGTAPMLESSQPVYAQVPRDRVVWDPRGDAVAGSVPLERLACLTDAARRLHVVVRLPKGWQAPEMIDGCPASPVGEVAGRREIGGPNGFVVLPGPDTSLRANDPDLRILARISPSPGPDQAVTAWAQPLGPGTPVRVRLQPPALPDAPEDGTSYLRLEDVPFAQPGCWVISLAVDGRVVGSAILPVGERDATPG